MFGMLFWIIAGGAGFVLLGWQMQIFLIANYGQHPGYRDYLEHFCDLTACELPLQQDTYRLTLSQVEVVPHPFQPNVLILMIKLINKADFVQPYPTLQLTLTDREGWVVGRRAFSPQDYLLEEQLNRLIPGELSAVQLALAHPHEKVVDFEVNILPSKVSNN